MSGLLDLFCILVICIMFKVRELISLRIYLPIERILFIVAAGGGLVLHHVSAKSGLLREQRRARMNKKEIWKSATTFAEILKKPMHDPK